VDGRPTTPPGTPSGAPARGTGAEPGAPSAAIAGTPGPGRPMRRGRADVTSELAELRRHLVDVPPHHGGGTRRAVEERIARLETELAALDAAIRLAPSEDR
jgi:hypothetical protein